MHYPSGLRRIISGCNEDMKDQWCVREGQFSENYGKKSGLFPIFSEIF